MEQIKKDMEYDATVDDEILFDRETDALLFDLGNNTIQSLTAVQNIEDKKETFYEKSYAEKLRVMKVPIVTAKAVVFSIIHIGMNNILERRSKS